MAQPGRYESAAFLRRRLPKTASSHTTVLHALRGDPKRDTAAVMLPKQSSISPNPSA